MMRLVFAALGAALLFACSPVTDKAPTAEGGAQSAAAPADAAPAAVTGPITGVGDVTAVDKAGGTVTIKHEPIAAIQWTAMTMRFDAKDKAILDSVAVGDHVSFTLESADNPRVVTAITKQ